MDGDKEGGWQVHGALRDVTANGETDGMGVEDHMIL